MGQLFDKLRHFPGGEAIVGALHSCVDFSAQIWECPGASPLTLDFLKIGAGLPSVEAAHSRYDRRTDL
ncbi:hypothetical protein MUP77_06250 [Candidatus Bathyarchaeota archaeon]|nr:hypothetical protein [Candidatus Bathyarchaeota archaeon]